MNVVFYSLTLPQSDPNSGSTLQLDELEDLEDEVIQSETENQVINELKIRPKTKYRDTLLHPRFGIEGTPILYKNLYK